MRAAALLASSLMLPAVPAAVAADEITDQLDQARRYYDQGDVTGAIGELEFTLQALRGRVGQELLATFPAPADGWTVADADGDGQAAIPLAAAGTMLGRTYRAAEGGASIEAQLMSGGGFLQGLAGMLMSPQVLAAQPNARRVRIGRENAVVTYDPQARSAQLVLDLGGKATIMLQGENLADGEPLVDLANRWDLKRVKELLGA
jgi:hypothetical protein